MRRIVLIFLLFPFCLVFAENNAWFSEYRDPQTGILDTDKMMSDYAVPNAPYPIHHDNEVASIEVNSDNRVTVTFKDGSKKVFEKDVFNPERGWKQIF